MALHPSDSISLDNLKDLFEYKKPTAATIPKFEAVNVAALQFAEAILRAAPPCVDRDTAINLVRLAWMSANMAIACAPDPAKVVF